MGARLVGAALNPHWSLLLTADEHRVFLAMCHTASASRRIKRYMARLIAVNAIEKIAGGQGRGRRAYYRVRPGLMAVDNRPPAEIAELLKGDISDHLLDEEKVTPGTTF